MAQRPSMAWVTVVLAAAAAGCLPKFAPPSAKTDKDSVVAHTANFSSPHPASATGTGTDPATAGSGSGSTQTRATTDPFGNPTTMPVNTATSTPTTGKTSTPGPTATDGSGTHAVIAASDDPDLPKITSPQPTLPVGTPTPVPTAVLGDIIYYGTFKAETIGAGGTARDAKYANGVGTAAVLGNSSGPEQFAFPPNSPSLFFTDAMNNQIRQLDFASGAISVAFGDPTRRYTGADSTIAYMQIPSGLVYDPKRKVMYATDNNVARVLRLNLQGNTIGKDANSFDQLAGGVQAEYRDGRGNGPGIADSAKATFHTLQCLALNGDALYVTEADGKAVRKIDLTSTTFDVTTLAIAKAPGTSAPASVDEVDDPTDAKLIQPGGAAVSLDGKTLYVADVQANVIRSIDLSVASGKVKVFAGLLQTGFKDGPANTATFSQPQCLAIDKDYLYVGEGGNPRVRAISLADRSVKTVLGGLGFGQGVGDRLSCSFGNVCGLHADLNADNSLKALYVYDNGYQANVGARLVKITP